MTTDLQHALVDGLEKIIDDYPQVSSPAVAAGVIGDFHALVINLLGDPDAPATDASPKTLREMSEAATPGPWGQVAGGQGIAREAWSVTHAQAREVADAEFIVAAANSVRAMLAATAPVPPAAAESCRHPSWWLDHGLGMWRCNTCNTLGATPARPPSEETP